MNSPRILIAEDESIVAMDLQETLEGFGYEIAGNCGSGHAAINLAKNEKPDLVLMDIVLKGKTDGIEAASKIRKDFDIPTIFLTAYSDNETLKRAQNAQPLGYLNKPFKEKDLKTTIQMAINQKRVARDENYWAPWSYQILETIQVPVLLLDKQGKILKFTKSFKEFSGLPQNKIENKNWTNILEFYDENGKANPISISEYFKGDEKFNKYQLMVQCKGTEQKNVEIQLSTIGDKSKQAKACLVLIHDISEITMSPGEKRKMLELICNNLTGNFNNFDWLK